MLPLDSQISFKFHKLDKSDSNFSMPQITSQDLTLDEPVVTKGDPKDPVNRPDVYRFQNGDEVHMCAGETITREELRILYSNSTKDAESCPNMS